MTGNHTNSEKLDDLATILARFQEAMTIKLDVVTDRVESLERRSPKTEASCQFNESPLPPPHKTPHLKLDLPRFQGTDPLGWIFKISQFFTYHNTPEEERITVASFYLDGAALACYLSDFEALANRIVGLSPSDLLSCFVSGLKSETRREVLAQQPRDLSQAAGLARLHEEKINDLLRLSRPKPPY
ncbi:hypothetical protein A2U01_0021039 [Trifolium medium]|uniref:Retrotransposon gag domain-containing protein n=1 Tax=Trifolium medium TaxID=97028 RepID=A0A392NNH5_9FABA|nr:hypothetical protein [Trifolium medium]